MPELKRRAAADDNGPMRPSSLLSVGAVVCAALMLVSCGGVPTVASQNARFRSALKLYARGQSVFTGELLRGLSHLDLRSACGAAEQMRRQTVAFNTTVGSLRLPSAAVSDRNALVLADQAQATDLARAATADSLGEVVLAIGHWAKDGGPQLSAAIRLRQDLKS